jgi:hypothetical protein
MNIRPKFKKQKILRRENPGSMFFGISANRVDLTRGFPTFFSTYFLDFLSFNAAFNKREYQQSRILRGGYFSHRSGHMSGENINV